VSNEFKRNEIGVGSTFAWYRFAGRVRRSGYMSTYSASKIAIARKARSCARCVGTIERGAQLLTFKLGLKNDIHLHVDCALRDVRGYRCQALEQEARARIAAGTTCRAPCVGHRCCLPADHGARFHHQWVSWDRSPSQ
jgi:hypothetical protein